MADPIPLPMLPWRDCQFDAINPTDVSMMEGRLSEEQAAGTPFWKAQYTTNWMTPAFYGLFDAFVMKSSSRGASFIGYDLFRPRPIAHNNGKPLSGTKAGGGAFNGDAVLQSITSSAAIVVAGLPAGFKLSPGDYVELRMSQLVRSLHRIVENATANASGVVSLSIMFGLDTQHFTTAASVHFEKPSCVMTIDPGSVAAPKSWAGREASFSATEMFFS
ncbi:hypothetical protein [Sinorhizobium meliloti]|uniref:hypothetical protein n=1 Tax=Rhizobium meliloti TaxID=382 RepID=UPI0001E4CCCD|nr:hypothetical protein [Sinorhizobium meliloti]AEG06837.1 hypothetical protein SinmeB_5597 [Sinorhizobium meliloti BL225C]ASP54061.1 hypothetical protein CDO31_21460 [Sinorhizobium meliloti]MDE3774398.1 hypothetical protein [Sinorhizobium meliloti]MDE4548176.1 hypothetical protein [Sinorhizobium meliloti]MDE4571795.1 hypothetical protein [Sinorhizobium meliloti]